MCVCEGDFFPVYYVQCACVLLLKVMSHQTYMYAEYNEKCTSIVQVSPCVCCLHMVISYPLLLIMTTSHSDITNIGVHTPACFTRHSQTVCEYKINTL